jgi:hypothetical protein
MVPCFGCDAVEEEEEAATALRSKVMRILPLDATTWGALLSEKSWRRMNAAAWMVSASMAASSLAGGDIDAAASLPLPDDIMVVWL